MKINNTKKGTINSELLFQHREAREVTNLTRETGPMYCHFFPTLSKLVPCTGICDT